MAAGQLMSSKVDKLVFCAGANVLFLPMRGRYMHIHTAYLRSEEGGEARQVVCCDVPLYLRLVLALKWQPPCRGHQKELAGKAHLACQRLVAADGLHFCSTDS